MKIFKNSISFIIFAYIGGIACAGSIPNENVLNNKIQKTIQALINKNTNAIIDLLPQDTEIEVETDQYMSKNNIKKDFNSKGRVYAYLFDSALYLEINKSYLKQFKGKAGDDILVSISEVFQIADKKNMQYKYTPIVLNKKIKFVDVLFDWNGKKPFPDNWRYKLVFAPSGDDWVLVSLKIRD